MKRKKHRESKGNEKKGRNPDSLPNPWAYCETLPIIQEHEKCDLTDLSMLSCRSNYCIKTVSRGYTGKDRDDEVYRIYGGLVNQGEKFMRQWIRCFTLTRKKYVTNLARGYLKEKNIKLNEWIVGVKNGDRADLLALFLLNVVTGVHSFVHTKNRIWTTLHDNINTHQEYIQRCNLHLCYLGNGLYVELVPRMETVPFEIFGVTDPVNISMDAKPVAIGTITSEEQDTLTELLSIGITPTSHTKQPSPSTSASATVFAEKISKPTLSRTGDPPSTLPVCASSPHPKTASYDTVTTEQIETAQPSVNYDSVQAQHVQAQTDIHNKKKKILQKTRRKSSTVQPILSQIPDHSASASSPSGNIETRVKSDFQKQKTAQLDETAQPTDEQGATRDVRNPSSITIHDQLGDYAHLITNLPTVCVTRLSEEAINKATSVTKRKPLKVPSKQLGTFPNYQTAKKFRFKISKYGIRRKRKRTYSYKCQVKRCPRRFGNVTSWNQHHRSVHPEVTYTCEQCGKISTSPIQHRDHVYMHKETRYTCGRCYKSFPNISRLTTHRHLHKRQRLYYCFSPNCKRNYKWPQDLLRHVKIHLPIDLKCDVCNYRTREKRLFRQHSRIHTDEKPFKCRRCSLRFRHSMQKYRHEHMNICSTLDETAP